MANWSSSVSQICRLKTLRVLHDAIKSSLKLGVIILSNQQDDGQMMILIGQVGDHYHAGHVLQALVTQYGGRGGGKANLAQGMLELKKDLSDQQIIDLLEGSS